MRHRRIVVARYGGSEVLQVLEEECPEPGPGQVRVRVHAAGVSLPDVLAREGVHPETPRPPFTPGWDLVGEVERLGAGVSGLEPGQMVAAMPISGAYAELVCLPREELVPVPPGLDPAEAVSLVLNYITAYQMLHHAAKVQPGQRVLIHGTAVFGLYILGGWLLPGRRRVVPYSIQTLKRLKPALFRQDLATLLDLLRRQQIRPVIARRLPLVEARQAQELLEKGGVVGKIALVREASPGKDA